MKNILIAVALAAASFGAQAQQYYTPEQARWDEQHSRQAAWMAQTQMAMVAHGYGHPRITPYPVGVYPVVVDTYPRRPTVSVYANVRLPNGNISIGVRR